MKKAELTPIITRALAEDVGTGDVTTLSIIPEDKFYTGRFISKAAGIVAGLEVARLTFEMLDKSVRFESRLQDGDWTEPGNILAIVTGSARAILTAERVALNFLQRMSGIATLTNRFVTAVKETSAIIIDTRKTAPGLRVLDKWAVRAGGGQNHRCGLFDMVLIKDNHIKAAGGISAAVALVRSQKHPKLLVEIEVRSIKQLQEALELEVNRIMLDNMSPAEMHKAVLLANNRIPLEASGNISLDNVTAIAATGVNYISVGKLTHSVQAMDISFLL